jgi:hypothetical protein
LLREGYYSVRSGIPAVRGLLEQVSQYVEPERSRPTLRPAIENRYNATVALVASCNASYELQCPDLLNVSVAV